MLVDFQIKSRLKRGSIVIEPFQERNLSVNSYDLTLGNYFWRQRSRHRLRMFGGPAFVFDPTVDDIRSVYDLFDADEYESNSIVLDPGERVLGHTVEFAGGTVSSVNQDGNGGVLSAQATNSYLHSTSTAARVHVSACMCAGLGDVGYVNRWTLEITNHADYKQRLHAGSIICQLVFVSTAVPERLYTQVGRYQTETRLKKLMADWSPEDMLPGKLKLRPIAS